MSNKRLKVERYLLPAFVYHDQVTLECERSRTSTQVIKRITTEGPFKIINKIFDHSRKSWYMRDFYCAEYRKKQPKTGQKAQTKYLTLNAQHPVTRKSG